MFSVMLLQSYLCIFCMWVYVYFILHNFVFHFRFLFFTFATCHLRFTMRGLSHCCRRSLYSIYMPVLPVFALGKKGVVGKNIDMLLPACVSSRDGDEWRRAKRQCCGSRGYRDCVWLWFAITVVLFRLSKGQRRQLDRPTRHPPYQ